MVVMNDNFIDGVRISNAKIISVKEGDILRVMRSDDATYVGFGEIYFSTIKSKTIKAWKRHLKMTLNIVVPVGEIRFILYDARQFSKTYGTFQEVILSRDNYMRLTIPPMIWIGFQGKYNKESMLLNLANIQHDETEIERASLSDFQFNWH